MEDDRPMDSLVLTSKNDKIRDLCSIATPQTDKTHGNLGKSMGTSTIYFMTTMGFHPLDDLPSIDLHRVRCAPCQGRTQPLQLWDLGEAYPTIFQRQKLPCLYVNMIQ